MILRTAVPAVLIAAAFGLALPRVASYRAVWASIDAMTWPYALLVGTAAAASMVTYWITIRAVLPWIGLRQAAAVSLGSNAVASIVPVGGAVAVGVSWAMLSSWGLSTADYVLYTVVTGILNVCCTFPPCRRPEAQSDYEHSIPYEKGGRTCLCEAGPVCRHNHRDKQAPGWHLEQAGSRGWFRWTTPSGRSYLSRPTQYPD